MLKETLLKERFVVWGKFTQEMLWGEKVLMRPEARIVRRDGVSTFNGRKERADAVIVMLNPGSCVPIMEASSEEWMEARPDKTQFQLMRLMERMAWDEMVIVNLSDLCQGNPQEFAGLQMRCEAGGIQQSRFTESAESEWSSVISAADRLLYGWGATKEAKIMADAHGLLDLDGMLAKHGKRPIAAWQPEKGYPKHPFPRIPSKCEAWLEEMVMELEKSGMLHRV